MRPGSKVPTPAWNLTSLFLLGVALTLSTGCGAEKALSSESTDLFYVEMWSDEGLVRLGDSRNVTNRQGYDNQPSYSADGRSVLYVSREGRSSDIYRYDLETEQTSRLTSTGDREYSPKVLPSGDGFSAIRAERDSRRRLWSYTEDGTQAELIWHNIDHPMLYYAWVDATTAAIVLEDNSGRRVLYVVDVDGGAAEPRVENVGRSINRIPGRHAVSFVHKVTPADWWISEIDFDTGEIRQIARTIQGAEDHAWTPSGAIVMGGGAEVYMRVPGGDESWRSVADYSREGIRKITRIAVSPTGDSMVLVVGVLSNALPAT